MLLNLHSKPRAHAFPLLEANIPRRVDYSIQITKCITHQMRVSQIGRWISDLGGGSDLVKPLGLCA